MLIIDKTYEVDKFFREEMNGTYEVYAEVMLYKGYYTSSEMMDVITLKIHKRAYGGALESINSGMVFNHFHDLVLEWAQSKPSDSFQDNEREEGEDR